MQMHGGVPRRMVKAGIERDITGGNVLRLSEKNSLFLPLDEEYTIFYSERVKKFPFEKAVA